MNRYCLVVPVYNHGDRLVELFESLEPFGLDCFLVDDGSDAACAAVIDEVAGRFSFVRLIRMAVNRGKGVAVVTALKAAREAGFTHAIQMDSDGQHSPRHLPDFIAAADAHPERVVSGYRPYEDMPPGRGRGRKLTDFWVTINTVSRSIRDSMCGYRVYPLEATVRLLARHDVGHRMDFDTDIIVRLYWSGIDVEHVNVKVRYDAEVSSHFRMVADNARISLMHTRHFFGMLPRLPWLLVR